MMQIFTSAGDETVVPIGRNGTHGHLTVELGRFTDDIHARIYDYGLRQILNDAAADKDGLSKAEIVAKAHKRLDALYAGEWRRRGTGPDDPVEVEAWKLAWGGITTAVKKFPEWDRFKKEKDRVMAVLAYRAKMKGSEPPTREAVIEAWLEKFPTIREAAARNVEAANVGVAGAADMF